MPQIRRRRAAKSARAAAPAAPRAAAYGSGRARRDPLRPELGHLEKLQRHQPADALARLLRHEHGRDLHEAPRRGVVARREAAQARRADAAAI